MQTQPWFILGAGSIGCLFAAYLRRADKPAALVLRDAAALEQWRRSGGIHLQRGEHIETVEVPVHTAADLPTSIQRVLVCTKAHQTEAAVAAIRPALAADALLVLLQNGLGVRERLQPLLPQAQLLHALSTEGAYQPQRFHIVHAGRGSTVVGGGTAQAALAEQTAALLQCELNIEPAADITERLWLKLAVNSVINPLTALRECRNGELQHQPGIEADVMALCAELSPVAAAAGAPLPPERLAAAVFEVMRATASNRSSMLQDIERRRRSEIDFINGHIVRSAHAAGLPCARHEALWLAVQEKEQRLRCL